MSSFRSKKNSKSIAKRFILPKSIITSTSRRDVKLEWEAGLEIAYKLCYTDSIKITGKTSINSTAASKTKKARNRLTNDGFKVIDEIYSAVAAGNTQLAQKLLNSNYLSIIRKRPDGKSLLDIAIETDNIEMIYTVLSNFNITKIDLRREDQILPLFIASRFGCVDFLKKWKNKGLNFNVSDSCGNTALHCAMHTFSEKNSYVGILTLLNGGANPNIKNALGYTPLHFLIGNFKEGKNILDLIRSIVWHCIEADANMNDCDPKGRTLQDDINPDNVYNYIHDWLNFGIYLNIRDESGLTILDYIHEELQKFNYLNMLAYRQPTLLEKKLHEPVTMLIHHYMIKMENVNFWTDKELQSRFDDLKDWLEFMDNGELKLSKSHTQKNLSEEKACTCIEQCEGEENKLEHFESNGFSLFEMIFENQCEMMEIVRDTTLKDHFEISRAYKIEFPIFENFLKKQYDVGRREVRLLQAARSSLKYLNLPLPELCLDYILDQFSDSELRELIHTILHLNF